MLTITNHLTAFWTVVVMNCIQPVNWKYCLPIHEWLIPEVVEGYKIWSDPSIIYKSERDHLQRFDSAIFHK